MASDDKMYKLMDDVEDVKAQMSQNIDNVLENTEKLDVLEDKTDTLKEGAQMFKKKSTQLKRDQWWKDKKLAIITAIVIIFCIVAAVIVVLITIGALLILGYVFIVKPILDNLQKDIFVSSVLLAAERIQHEYLMFGEAYMR